LSTFLDGSYHQRSSGPVKSFSAEIREDAEEETDENIEARKQAKLEEWLDEKRSELENVSWDYS
jgi:hypothetical protein